MLAIERAEEFYGNAPDGYPEWEDLTEKEQDYFLDQLIHEGKVTLCGYEFPAWRNFPAVFCDEEADPVSGYCHLHTDQMNEDYR